MGAAVISRRESGRRIALGGFLLLAAIGLADLASADAAAFTVTNTADAGAGSLRQAIMDANASSGGDTITFAPGVTGVIALQSGELIIEGDTQIQGPGADKLTISGNGANRVFSVEAMTTVGISGLTISGGRVIRPSGGNETFDGGGNGQPGDTGNVPMTIAASGSPGLSVIVTLIADPPVQGGGIRNEGNLTLERVAVTGNTAIGDDAIDFSATTGSGGRGGDATANGARGGDGGPGGNTTVKKASAGAAQGAGIYNSGVLTLNASTVSGNVAQGGTGGDAHATGGKGGDGGNGTTTDATGGDGGAGGATTVNGMDGGAALGGGIYNAGTLTVANSTVAGNLTLPGAAAGTATQTAGADGADGTGSGGGFAGNGGSGGAATAIAGAPGGTRGGGIDNAEGSATIDNSTIAGNRSAAGANIAGGTGVSPRSTIVADPLGGSSCDAALRSAGFNLDSGTSCGLTEGTDRRNKNPQLGPLKRNGGPTQTKALAATSPAIDHGDGKSKSDQNGSARTVDFRAIRNARGGDGTDIGAVEARAPKCKGRRASRPASLRRDKLRGTAKADVFAGLGGNDLIIARGGNDVVCAGAGNDKVLGGKGKDRLLGGAGKDTLLGGPGRDSLNGGPGKDTQKQ